MIYFPHLSLFTKQKQTHRHRKQIYGYQRREVGAEKDKAGLWEQHRHVSIYKINKDLLYSTGNPTQYSVITSL